MKLVKFVSKSKHSFSAESLASICIVIAASFVYLNPFCPLFTTTGDNAIPLQNRINRQHGTYIVDYAEQIGLGMKSYQLIDIQTSGINGTQATTTYRYNVYSLDGKKILDNATNLDGLAKGTYIVNGEKRIIE